MPYKQRLRIATEQNQLMEQLQRRRNTFRLDIRRRDIDSKMRSIRTHLESSLHYDNTILIIQDILSSDLSMIYIRLARHFSECHENQKKSCAQAIWYYLTSRHFQTNSESKQGLPYLLIAIYQYLCQDKKPLLSSQKIIESLISELYSCAQANDRIQPKLFSVAFQVSIYASKQSKNHINFSQQKIEKIINIVHSSLTQQPLQVLLSVLMNLEENTIRSYLKPKLRQIGRRIFNQLDSDPSQRQLKLRLLTLIGCHEHYMEKEKHLIDLLLNEYNVIGFQLVLKFLAAQTQEPFMAYQVVRMFLDVCPLQMKGWKEICCFLDTICHLAFYEQEQIFIRIYRRFFQGKLHHFVSHQTLQSMTSLVTWLLSIQDETLMSELVSCGINILRIGSHKIDEEKMLMLSYYVLINEQCSESELKDLIGQDNFMIVWERYSQGITDNEV